MLGNPIIFFVAVVPTLSDLVRAMLDGGSAIMRERTRVFCEG